MKEINYQFLKNTIKPRPYNAHKGSMGSLLSICGSYGMAGAEILSAKSALRTGVGLLTLLLHKLYRRQFSYRLIMVTNLLSV